MAKKGSTGTIERPSTARAEGESTAAKRHDSPETRGQAEGLARGAKAKTSAAKEYASAMDKLRDEMATDHSRYVTVVGEYLTNYLLEHPEAEAALLNSAKTIHGSLKQLEAEARKQGGKVGIIEDAEAFGMVLDYFGISEGTGNRQQATGETVRTGTGDHMGSPLQTTAPVPAPDPFDLDALLGVG